MESNVERSPRGRRLNRMRKDRWAITATAVAPKRCSRLRVMCPWRFHAPGFPLLSVREIRGHGLKLYGWEGWPDLISTITDEVLAEVEQWQTRPLEAMYPIVD